ncbi:MAG: trimeric intracellular cation channel family protein [Pseudomonadales bacterium]|nr:trimeric intracellular cation channel family protein [Pseudomonadales bacterium]MBO6594711.1 trimeric intracellular cation channel family protein [Pseudomonadales bacterium]MBO6821730.1 trimeric intracellular cation channel family protein [Pseudomonadales bacterium]
MTLIELLDHAGVFVFAITGALVAVRKEMDFFGFVVLALMPAVGGGTLRDIMLDEPVFWITDTTYLFVTLAAALITFVAHHLIQRLSEVLLWLDALGLSVFCAIGCAKALELGQGPVVAVVMGVITAVAGGIVRDVIANESPLVLHKEVYATAAFMGSLTYVVVPLSDPLCLVLAVAVAFVVRALGITLGLSLPTVKHR